MKSKILLLEDDYNLSETVAEYFIDEGFDVVCVYDGEDAISKIYEENFDIFLFDVNVPKKNGFEVLKEARKEQKMSPAIFITSLNSVTLLTPLLPFLLLASFTFNINFFFDTLPLLSVALKTKL